MKENYADEFTFQLFSKNLSEKEYFPTVKELPSCFIKCFT